MSVMIEAMEAGVYGSGSTSGRYINVRATVLDKTPRPYTLHVTGRDVTVVFNPAVRRHLGKTFHAMHGPLDAQLKAAYKRDGAILADLVAQATAKL